MGDVDWIDLRIVVRHNENLLLSNCLNQTCKDEIRVLSNTKYTVDLNKTASIYSIKAETLTNSSKRRDACILRSLLSLIPIDKTIALLDQHIQNR